MSSHKHASPANGSERSSSINGKNWFLALSLLPAAIAGVTTTDSASAREPVRPATAPADNRHEAGGLHALTLPTVRHANSATTHTAIPCRSGCGPLQALVASRHQAHNLRFAHHREFDGAFLNTASYLTYMGLGEDKHNKARLDFVRSVLTDATTRVVDVIPLNPKEKSYKVISRTPDTITLERKEGTVVVDKTIHLPLRTVTHRLRLEQSVVIEVSPYLQVRSITLRSVMPKQVGINQLLDSGPFTTELRFSPSPKNPGNTDLSIKGSMRVTTHRHVLRNVVLNKACDMHNEQCAGVLRRALSTVEKQVEKGECKLTFLQLAAQGAELARAIRK